MKQNFTNLSVLCFLGIGISAYGQTGKYDGKVGINTSMPAATLAVQVSNSNAASTTNEGILAPKLSKTRVANIANTNLAEGTLVYVTDDAPSRISSYKGGNSKVSEITEKGYYYYNGDKWVKATGSGTSGRDGASFLSGTKAPTNEGNNGDTYVNTKTGEVYTKSSNTWKKVSGASLKGPKGNDGSNGSNGNSMTSGSGTPSGGIDGDTYLDTNTGDVWRKASGNWAKTGTTLKGANGAPGAPGTPGTPGKQGKPGKPGRDGTSFLSGTTAPLNNKGNNGDTYVNIKTGEVYTKSSGTWTKVSGASLKGSNGSKGNSMTSGSGAPSGGIDGDTYLDTSTGEVWRKTSGSWAKTGTSLKGDKGKDGTNGASFLSGSTVPEQSYGKEGDTYLATNTGVIWKKGASGWTTDYLGLKGPKGDNGNTIRTGVGAPTASTEGTNGDYYIDLATYKMYGPKGSSSLNGGWGNNGARLRGNSMTSGSGFPSGGVDGDTYLNTSTGDVWKKDSGTWTKKGSLKGPKGDPGSGGGSSSSSGGDTYTGSETIEISSSNVISVKHPVREITPIPFGNQQISLSSVDNGGYVYVNFPNPVDLYIPNNLPQGFSCVIIQQGAGQVTLKEKGTNVVLHSARGTKTRTQYSAVAVIRRTYTDSTSSEYTITGDAVKL